MKNAFSAELPAWELMNASFDAEVAALRAATSTATQVRELAQDRIVQAFGRHLRGVGTGPTDGDLQSFARFVLVEAALQKHLDSVMGSTEVAGASRVR